MDNEFKDLHTKLDKAIRQMQERKLIELSRQGCNFGQLMKALCDADFRHNLNVGKQVQIRIFATIPYHGTTSDTFSAN